MNILLISKFISYNQFAYAQLNEAINHILGHGIEMKSFYLDNDSDGKIQMEDIHQSF